MADSSSDEHNSQQIIQEAESKLAQSGINAAQNVYQNALLDWVDDVTMGGGGEDGHNAGPDMVGSTSTSSSSGGGGGMSKIKGEIVQLWLSYAELNRRANLVSLTQSLMYCI